MYKNKDYVEIIGIGKGWVTSIRHDDTGGPIYTVLMEQKPNPDSDFMLARDCELREVS